MHDRHPRNDWKIKVKAPRFVKSAFFSFALAGILLLTHSQARAQADQNHIGVFATVGGGNTQFPLYADNALGFNFGAFYQRSTFLGAEARIGTYPIAARYTQMPMMFGYRIGARSAEGTEDSSPLRAARWAPFFFAGGGINYAQDSGTLYLNKPLDAQAEPGWEISGGADLAFTHFSWRVAEVSWVKTYAAGHILSTPYLSTGIVYHFKK
jgi:hypothetical protein